MQVDANVLADFEFAFRLFWFAGHRGDSFKPTSPTSVGVEQGSVFFGASLEQPKRDLNL